MRPVLFVHGAWHGPWAWEGWLPLFEEQGYVPHALTLRGHGPGDTGYRGVAIEDYVEDLEQAVRDQPEPPVLVGHSLGGLLIQHLLAERRLSAAVHAVLEFLACHAPAKVGRTSKSSS